MVSPGLDVLNAAMISSLLFHASSPLLCPSSVTFLQHFTPLNSFFLPSLHDLSAFSGIMNRKEVFSVHNSRNSFRHVEFPEFLFPEFLLYNSHTMLIGFSYKINGQIPRQRLLLGGGRTLPFAPPIMRTCTASQWGIVQNSAKNDWVQQIEIFFYYW